VLDQGFNAQALGWDGSCGTELLPLVACHVGVIDRLFKFLQLRPNGSLLIVGVNVKKIINYGMVLKTLLLYTVSLKKGDGRMSEVILFYYYFLFNSNSII
jgi:hypothetical protein